MKTNHLLAACAALCLFSSPSRADWNSCLDSLRHSAAASGVSGQTISSALGSLEPNDAVSFMDKQPEFTTPVWDYIAGLVDEERVEEGRELMQKNASSLRAAESRFGVDPAAIVAVWGVESDFGKSFGKRPVVQSLATLVCEAPRRNEYFKKELMAALKILDHGDIAPQEFVGSWAGAFGHTQFMPSTFLTTAVDLDGDGRKNIASSAADALGSTANYLHKSGWTHGMPWGFEVRLPDGYSGPSGRTNRQPMSSWASRGIGRLDGGPLGEGRAALLLPATGRPFWSRIISTPSMPIMLRNHMPWPFASSQTVCAVALASRRPGPRTIQACRGNSAANCRRCSIKRAMMSATLTG
jgi:lytic murein transglycosylase